MTGSDLNDLWVYNPSKNTWSRLGNIGGGGIIYGSGFSIGSKGYIGTGQDNYGIKNNRFWQFQTEP
jgi:hypothetical protein